ncbi:MAG: hypothetical protein R3Y22_10135, partial [Bacteroidales bacterium]
SYHTLSRIVKKRLTSILDRLYSEGKYYYHISLTSRRDILVAEELVKFRKAHPNVKILLFEITNYPEHIAGFNDNDVKRYWRVADSADIHVHHPIEYGEDKLQKLNITFSESVSTVIAYGDCVSSSYFSNRDLDVRYLLTEREMWPEELNN